MKKENTNYSGKHAASGKSTGKAKRRTGLVVALVFLVLIAALIVAGIFYYNSKLGMLNYDNSEEAVNVSDLLEEELKQQEEAAAAEKAEAEAKAAAEAEAAAKAKAEEEARAKAEAEAAAKAAAEAEAAAKAKAEEEARAKAEAEAAAAKTSVVAATTLATRSGEAAAETETLSAAVDGQDPDDTLEVGDHEVKTSGGVKSDTEALSSKNIVNILIIGSDQRIPGTSDRGRADAVMLVSLDKSSGSVRMASFERAIGMPVEGQLDVKLNDLLNVGDAILIQKTVSECFSVEIDGYVHLDYDSFPKVIDAIGGIDLEFDALEASFFNGRITRDVRSTFVAQAGWNHLPGYEALVYCRLRLGDDNWGRQARTRAVLGGAIDKVKNMSLKELNDLANEVLPLIHTNLTKGQISSILLSAPKFLSPKLSQLMIPDQNSVWVYHGHKDEAMYGFDFDAETQRLHDFILGK